MQVASNTNTLVVNCCIRWGVPVIPLRFLSNERTSFYSDLICSDMNMSTSFTWPTWPSWPAWPVKLATLFLFSSKFVESIAVGTSLNIVIWCRNVNGSKPTSRTSYHCNCIFVLYFDVKSPKIAGMSCDWGELSIHLIYFAKFQVLRKKKISQKRTLQVSLRSYRVVEITRTNSAE